MGALVVMPHLMCAYVCCGGVWCAAQVCMLCGVCGVVLGVTVLGGQLIIEGH